MANPFNFLKLPVHPPKPRNVGLFIGGDSGTPLRAQEDFLETYHDLVDYMKLTGHVRLLSHYKTDWIVRKLDLYKKYGIDTLPGGISFEVAVLQQQTTRFFNTLREIGFTGVEISEDVIPPMAPKARGDIIAQARDAGLAVFTEVGRKFPTEPMTTEKLVELIRADLDSGSRMVVIELSEIVPLKQRNPQVLIDTAATVGHDKVIFETHIPGPELLVWLIRTIGPDVNLMGHTEYCPLAHDCRLGMNRQVGYTFLTEMGGKL